MRNSLKKYQSVSTNNILDSDPHTLISLIFQHILTSIAVTKGAITHNEIENKGKNINKAIALIGELVDSLDMEQGGEVARNLAALYDYSIQQLIEVHTNNKLELLDEISLIFINIKEGWDNIPPHQRVEAKATAVAL